MNWVYPWLGHHPLNNIISSGTGDKARLASLRTTTSTVKRRIEEEKETDKIKENIPLGPS
jgi:hypothetical protein